MILSLCSLFAACGNGGGVERIEEAVVAGGYAHSGHGFVVGAAGGCHVSDAKNGIGGIAAEGLGSELQTGRGQQYGCRKQAIEYSS